MPPRQPQQPSPFAKEPLSFVDSLRAGKQSTRRGGGVIIEAPEQQVGKAQADAVAYLGRVCAAVKSEMKLDPARGNSLRDAHWAAFSMAQQIYFGSATVPTEVSSLLAKHGNDPDKAPILPGFVNAGKGGAGTFAEVLAKWSDAELKAAQIHGNNGKLPEARPGTQFRQAVDAEVSRRASGGAPVAPGKSSTSPTAGPILPVTQPSMAGQSTFPDFYSDAELSALITNPNASTSTIGTARAELARRNSTTNHRSQTMSTQTEPMDRTAAKAKAEQEWGAMSATDRQRWTQAGYVGFRTHELTGQHKTTGRTAIVYGAGGEAKRGSQAGDRPTLPAQLPTGTTREEAASAARQEWAGMDAATKARWFNESAYVSYRKATCKARR